jgi:arylsulfatase A-like enzyme
LSALFSGHYFSQLEWREFGRGASRFLYPAADRTSRFPELLTAGGVSTTTIGSITFLSSEFGVVRGFSEETVVVKGRDHGMAQQVIPPLVTRLNKVKNEPFFAYVHLTEPHAPYDRAGTEGSLTKRYHEEIRLADKYVALVLDTLQKRFPSRGYLIVSSDHGEAFGEHGTTKHTKTLYEELLRVPLFIRGPGISARNIDEHVSLIDLGPTILDLFGVNTPADFMGQSLVPLLAGRTGHLNRPIVAEGRLRRVLYWGDLKIIDDPRRKVVEAYDLQKDPRELRNLFDTDRERVLPALAALRGFFEVHRLRIDGYEAPYKP